MNLVMIICLVAVAMVLVLSIQMLKNRACGVAEDKVMKNYFLMGLSGLMARIAMADGCVTNDEADLAYRIFNNMKLSDSEKALCIGRFVSARRDGLEARDHAKRFMAYGNFVACEYLYYLLWTIAGADGRLDESEDKLLKDIAMYLGLPEGSYEAYKNGKKPRCSKAELIGAGVPESLAALAG